MYTFKKFLGRYSLLPVIGTFSFAALLAIIPHFFIDMLLVTTYRHGQSDFQRFYLIIHWTLLIFAMMDIVYGFWAINKRTYHAISNFRSWTLLVGLSLSFSGFFSVIGFALDWPKFAKQCAIDLERLHSNNFSHDRVQEDCRHIYAALLTTHSFLWAVTEACLIILFFTVNSYKVTNFQDEERERQKRSRKELAKRNKRVRAPTRDVDEEEEEDEDEERDDDESDGDVEKEKGTQLAVPSKDSTPPRSIQFAPLPASRRNSRTNVSQAMDQLDKLCVPPTEPPMVAFQQNRPLTASSEQLRLMAPSIVVESPNGTPYSMSTARSLPRSSPLLAPLLQSGRGV